MPTTTHMAANCLLEQDSAKSQAMAALFERVMGRIHRYFHRVIWNRDDAEDCYQQTLERLVESLQRGTYDAERSFNTWLWLKARAVYAQHCRRAEGNSSALAATPAPTAKRDYIRWGLGLAVLTLLGLQFSKLDWQSPVVAGVSGVLVLFAGLIAFACFSAWVSSAQAKVVPANAETTATAAKTTKPHRDTKELKLRRGWWWWSVGGAACFGAMAALTGDPFWALLFVADLVFGWDLYRKLRAHRAAAAKADPCVTGGQNPPSKKTGAKKAKTKRSTVLILAGCIAGSFLLSWLSAPSAILSLDSVALGLEVALVVCVAILALTNGLDAWRTKRAAGNTAPQEETQPPLTAAA